MRINSLYLAHFGRFHQEKIQLQPGINVIYGENEAGKSTVHHFIQAMLFGVERLRGKASKKDEYSRFQPWEQGKNYEGTMEITHDGMRYRLIRNFYREDEYFRVEQLDTGKEMYLPGNQMDALVEGLNRNNFKNTLSISQLESQVDQSFGLSLQAYMANVQRTKSQAVDLGKTIDYLKKEKKNCQSSEAEKRMNELKNQREEMIGFGIEREPLLEEIQKRQEMLEQIRGEIKHHSREDKETRRKENKERMEAIRLIEENNHIAAQYQQKKTVYEQLQKQAEEDRFDELKEQWAEASVDHEDLADRYDQMWGRNLAILFSIMMFGLIPVIGVFFLFDNMAIRLAACGCLVTLLFVVMIFLRSMRKGMKRKVEKSKAELQHLQQQMEGQMFGRGSSAMLRQLKEELQALRDQYEKLQIPLQPYLEKYGDDISLELDEEEDETLEFLRDKEQRILKSLERLLVQKELIEQRETDLEMLESEMALLEEEVRGRQEKADIISECMQIIQDLSEDIHSDFGPALNCEVSKLMWELSGGRYEQVAVDNELNLKVDTGNGFVTAEQLSTGTKEQLYLALRMAMVNLLYPKKNLPILFDDSFVYYDDKRLGRVLSWLGQQGYEQILIFTCQHREGELLKRMGMKYNEIYL